jgi:hypothetical protein
MYNEEYLPQDSYDYDNDEDNISVNISSDDNSEIIINKVSMEKRKKMDPDYLKQKIVVNGETKRIESFASKLNCNAVIRNAITGRRAVYRNNDSTATIVHRVGSNDESFYFSVTDTTTKCNEPRRLYFNSPEEFERHYQNTIKVDTSIKNAWLQRNIKMRTMRK